jgi:nitroreductase
MSQTSRFRAFRSKTLLLCLFFIFSQQDSLMAQSEFTTLVKKRRSGRSYNPHKEVSRGQIEQLLEAARWAPSSYGEEPWRFVIAHKGLNPESYKKVLESLVEFNQGWAKNAPVLIVISAKSNFKKNNQPNRWGAYDTGSAAQNISLMATSIGLMAHQMGGFDPDKVRESFNIPADVEIISVMALGYELPDATDANATRQRMPIDAIAAWGQWSADL